LPGARAQGARAGRAEALKNKIVVPPQFVSLPPPCGGIRREGNEAALLRPPNLKRRPTMTKTTPNRPTHRVYAVTKTGERKYWREIGAAWPHKDGEGFGVKLELFPFAASEIVIRKPVEASKAAGGAQ
jgi:hypothetical protein